VSTNSSSELPLGEPGSAGLDAPERAGELRRSGADRHSGERRSTPRLRALIPSAGDARSGRRRWRCEDGAKNLGLHSALSPLPRRSRPQIRSRLRSGLRSACDESRTAKWAAGCLIPRSRPNPPRAVILPVRVNRGRSLVAEAGARPSLVAAELSRFDSSIRDRDGFSTSIGQDVTHDMWRGSRFMVSACARTSDR